MSAESDLEYYYSVVENHQKTSIIKACGAGKKWRNSSGDLMHTIDISVDNGQVIITSKKWLKHKRRWHFSADALESVLFQKRLWKANREL